MSLKLFSKFALTDSNGVDLTPVGTKARGLIALLALSPEFTRNRIWLQDKLWSDRAPEQSSGSLRQALSDIRRSLGDCRELLVTDRDSISLSPEYFRINDEIPKLNGVPLNTELFPSLDVKDAEFEHWIRDQRERIVPLDHEVSESQPKPQASLKIPTVIFQTEMTLGISQQALAVEVIKNVSNSLLEFSDFRIFSDLVSSQEGLGNNFNQGVMVLLQISSNRDYQSISATIANPITGQLHWMNSIQLDDTADKERQNEQIIIFCSQLFESIVDSFSEESFEIFGLQAAALFGKLGRNLLFQLDKQSLSRADQYLESAYEIEPHGHLLAWRSYIRNISQFEHKTLSFLDNDDGMDELIREAVAQDPTNSTTLAVAAQIEYIGGASIGQSLNLANQSVERNPANAFGLAMLANTHIANGDFQAGSAAAQNALNCVTISKSRFFFEFFCCMAATGNKDYSTAIKHGEAAFYLKPDFRAPLRYLLVLYKATGQAEKFSKAYDQMRELEPGFEFSQILEDWYPAHTLRRLSIIDSVESDHMPDHSN